MSELKSIDDCSVKERSDLGESENNLNKHENEAANNSHDGTNGGEINDEYILSLLNNSDSSKDIDSHQSFTELALNNSGDLDAENASKISNESSIQEDCLKENSDNVLTSEKDVQIDDKNENGSKEEKKNDDLKVTREKEYRDSDSPWTDDEDSSSSSSSDSDILFESIEQNPVPKANCVKTKGELDIEDLPPIEYLKISVNEDDLRRVGQVHAVVLKLVVIQASKDEKPLDIDSVLFLAPNEPLGRIFEVFGPVVEPFYTVLFNAPEDIIEKGVKVGSDVFYAPLKNEITSYVFVDVLRQQKGSDASWKDNNEPPEEHLDYSDDEQERAARLKRRGKGRALEYENDDEVQVIPYKISPNEKRTFNYTSYARNNSYEAQKDYLTQNHRNSNQSNRNFVKNSSNLDNVPVWISSPPPYLEPKPLPAQTNVTTPVQPFQLKQPASIQNQLRPFVRPSSSQTQFGSGPLLLNPKQPFVPRQPPNLNSQRQLLHSQSSSQNLSSQRQLIQHQQSSSNLNSQRQPIQPQQSSSNLNSQRQPMQPQQSPSPNLNSPRQLTHPQQSSSPIQRQLMQPQLQHPAIRNNSYFSSPPRPSHQMVHNASGPVLFQNPHNNMVPNQHIFGQITPVGIMSPAPPMSPAIFSPCPSPVYIQPNVYRPFPSPALSPNHFWGPQNQHAPTFSAVQSPPPTSPLTIQIPTFSNPPPSVRFSVANNFSAPPPSFPSQNNFSSNPYSTRF